jgi:hypothetical protein
MKNDINKIAKDILTDSKLELTNPQFNSMILSEISINLERKARRKIFIVFIFILLMIGIAVCLVIRIFNIDVFKQVVGSDSPSTSLSGLTEIIRENEYFILPILLFLIVKKIISPGVKYSNQLIFKKTLFGNES